MLNYGNGHTIGFESAKMFYDINKIVFRAYDMILVMVFHSFGPSMSADLFEQIFNENQNWKFHKGKYMKEYAKLMNYMTNTWYSACGFQRFSKAVGS